MKNGSRPWKLSFNHPHANVLIEQKPLLKDQSLLADGESSPQRIDASFVTDHPVLNELIQIGIAVLSVALPLVVGGLKTEMPAAAPSKQ